MDDNQKSINEQIIDKIQERMAFEYLCEQMDKQLMELMNEDKEQQESNNKLNNNVERSDKL